MSLKTLGIYAVALGVLFGNQPAIAEDSGLPNSYMADKISNIDLSKSAANSLCSYPNKNFYSGISLQLQKDPKVNGYVQVSMSNKYPITRYFISGKENRTKVVSLTEFVKDQQIEFTRTTVTANGLYPNQLIVVKGGKKGLNGLFGQEVSLGDGRLQLSAGPNLAEINALYNISLGSPQLSFLYIGDMPFGNRNSRKMIHQLETQLSIPLSDDVSIFGMYTVFSNEKPIVRGGLQLNF